MFFYATGSVCGMWGLSFLLEYPNWLILTLHINILLLFINLRNARLILFSCQKEIYCIVRGDNQIMSSRKKLVNKSTNFDSCQAIPGKRRYLRK